jgi:dextranase
MLYSNVGTERGGVFELKRSLAHAIGGVLQIAGAVLLSSAAFAGNAHIFNVNTDKAMYAPGTGVTIYVDLANSTQAAFSNGSVEVRIHHLGDTAAALPPQPVAYLGAGETAVRTFSWTPPPLDFKGYLIEVALKDSAAQVIGRGSSAIDVSSHWRRFPRYGYLSRFDAGLNTGHLIWQLKNFHINGLQYYDVGYKHHIPAPPPTWNAWPDVANRTISRSTVTGFTSAARSYNIQSLIYDDWGAAYDDCYTDGSGVTLSMGRFRDAPASQSNQYTWDMPPGWATGRLWLMNNRSPDWQNYIFGRMQDAYDQLGFDGWHMDSLITNWQALDFWGNAFNVYQYNPDFLNAARTCWGSDTPLVQNLIDGSGLDWMKSANADFIYAELWGNYPNYYDLKRFFDESRRYSSKAVVYAAYMNYDKSPGYFNEPGVRLANAAIFASGASHLELGDGDQMLSNEYFPNRDLQMTGSLRQAMRVYYDVLVAYQNLLRDDTVSADQSVSAEIGGVPVSAHGAAGTVWVIPKTKPGLNILHLVNLLNNPSSEWKDADGSYPAPPVRTDLQVKMYHTGTIGDGRLFCAAPDSDFGKPFQLTFTAGNDGGGSFITFTVPRLEYWTMLWLEINGLKLASARIQAEDCDTYAAVGTETCHDAGGGKNTAYVNNVNGESYIGFGKVNFSQGALSVSARVASELPDAVIEFRLNNSAGPVIAEVPVGNTGGWQNWQTKTTAIAGVSGVHDLYIVFKNAASNLNWFTFSLAPNTPPAAPGGLTAIIQNQGIDLDWIDNSEPDLAGYSVLRSTASGDGYIEIASDLHDSQYRDPAVVSGTKYYYVVKAVDNLALSSGNSNEVSAMVLRGDLTLDARVDMQDIEKLAGQWRIQYDFETLLQVANDWLLDGTL